MKKYITIILMFVSLFSCHKHDKLWDSIVNIENRLTAIEQQCKEMNTNISSMRVVVDAVQNNDYVTGVSAVLENGIEVGYKISFNTHPAVIIYHGKRGQDGKDGQDGVSGETGSDGQDGLSPVIGVKQAEDGYYYWTQKLGTAESTWILDDNDNKIKVGGSDGQSVLIPHIDANGNWWIGETDTHVKASGNDGQNGQDGFTPRIGSNGNWWIGDTDTGIKAQGENGQDGKDGITPQLKIEDDNWMLSVDNGVNWRNLGRAKGDDGKSFFTNVINENDKLILELENGTSIELPKKQSFSFQLDKTYISNISPNTSYEVNYTITGGENQQIHIETIESNGWEVRVRRNDAQSGKIVVTTPSNITDGKVLVLAIHENGNTHVQSITLFKGNMLSVEQTVYTLEANGEDIEIEVKTGIDYQINIAAKYEAWISCQTDPLNRETFTLTVSANADKMPRTAIIELVNDNGIVLEEITVHQSSSTYKIIHVEEPGTLENLTTTTELNQYECVKITGQLNEADYTFLKIATTLKELDISDLDTESIPANAFAESKLQTVLLPKNLTAIPNEAFYQSAITSIEIPETVTSINESAFRGCKQLKGDLIIPNSVKTIGNYAFSSSSYSGHLTLGTSLTQIGQYAFSDCNFTGILVMPSDVDYISKGAFQNCSKFTNLALNENLRVIDDNAFDGCTGLQEDIVIPDNVTIIGYYAFWGCTGVEGKKLIIGKSVSSILGSAFAKGSTTTKSPLNFSEICFKGINPPKIQYGFGTGNSVNIGYVVVPVGCRNKYLEAFNNDKIVAAVLVERTF